MPALPSGTVTFLFSDVEGSTRLLQALGDRYGEVLDRHGAVFRQAIRRTGGHEVSTEDDSCATTCPRRRHRRRLGRGPGPPTATAAQLSNDPVRLGRAAQAASAGA